MKKTTLLIVASVVAIFVVSCDKTNTDTAQNLMDLAAETQKNSRVFAKYAEVARTDSMYNAAAMFEAMSLSKSIQAQEYQDILKKNKIDYASFDESKIEVGDTFENLKNARKTIESIAAKYKEYITVAEKDRVSSAVNGLTRMKIADGKLANYLMIAEQSMANAQNDAGVGRDWLVCVACGDIYLSGDMFDLCDICNSETGEFKHFGAQ